MKISGISTDDIRERLMKNAEAELHGSTRVELLWKLYCETGQTITEETQVDGNDALEGLFPWHVNPEALEALQKETEEK